MSTKPIRLIATAICLAGTAAACSQHEEGANVGFQDHLTRGDAPTGDHEIVENDTLLQSTGASGLLWRWHMDGVLSDESRGGAMPNQKHAKEWRVQATGDLNNDGATDLVWRNAISGAIEVGLLDGRRRQTALVPLTTLAGRSASLPWRTSTATPTRICCSTTT